MKKYLKKQKPEPHSQQFEAGRIGGSATSKAKQRASRANGALGGQRKLNESQVNAIRRAVAFGGISQQDLAERYGVSGSLVSRIVNGSRWETENAGD